MADLDSKEIGRQLTGTVLLATLGERDTIEVVLQEVAESCLSLKRFGWNIGVLIVDDSNDFAFHQAVEELSSTIQLNIKVIIGPGLGLGAAILTGFKEALTDEKVDVVINLDADGQHDGRQIGDLLRAHYSSGNDITIGSRWTRGGRSYGLSFARVIMSRCSSIALRLNGVPWNVKDPTTSFRIYNRGAIETIARELAGFGGFSFFGAAIASADKSGLVVREVPIHFRPRFAGVSNLRAPQVWRAVRDLRQIGAMSSMISRRVDPASMREFDSGYSAFEELQLLSASIAHTESLIAEFVDQIGSSVLEVGAGLGAISLALSKRDKSVTAFEPDEKLFTYLTQNVVGTEIRALNCTIHSYLSSNATSQIPQFDSVLYVSVLEHIRDDFSELVQAQKFLKPSGKLVVLVPAMPALYGILDSKSNHVRRYRKNELKTVIEESGLEVVDLRFVDPIGAFTYWLIYRVFGSNHVSSRMITLHSKAILPLSRRLTTLTRGLLPGRILVAVAVHHEN